MTMGVGGYASPARGDRRLLTIREMGAADAGAIAAGIPGIALMENAGAAVAEAIRERFAPRPTMVLAGPGNNGGDGFVVARRLARAGWPVRLALLGRRERLRGDAALAATTWTGEISALDPDVLDGAGLVVDALFGAGLARPLEGAAHATIEAIGARGLPSVAVDVPSGVHGDTGEVLGTAAAARATVTFHLAKPGHLLLPGRELVGELVVADIGIPSTVTDGLAPTLSANHPDVWHASMPRRSGSSHKYRHGHALVLGGDETASGAARLAAGAALRAGAGLVTVLCPDRARQVYGAQLTSIMLAPFADDDGFAAQLADHRRNGVLLGPGCGVGEPLARRVLMALGTGKATVLDADALTSFAGDPMRLLDRIQGPCLMTPHEGEFARLFDLAGDKLTRARAAAAASGAVILLKGADTVIAAPDGRAFVQADAPASLATAGSGDVLAGVALGLVVQGMPMLEAAAAAVWLHAQAARGAGPGLIAEDLVTRLPLALAALPPRAAGR